MQDIINDKFEYLCNRLELGRAAVDSLVDDMVNEEDSFVRDSKGFAINCILESISKQADEAFEYLRKQNGKTA